MPTIAELDKGIGKVKLSWYKMSNQNKIKYQVKLTAALAHFLLFILVILLFLTRKSDSLPLEFINRNFEDFESHISNFSITYLLIGGPCFVWLLFGVSFKYILFFSLFILVVTILYELYVPLLNVADLLDAYYGTWGFFLASLELFMLSKWGLTKIEKYGEVRGN